MASSGQLVVAISAATSTLRETVAVQMRNLRQAGLISVGGRGSSAAKMTPLDAARLLMAVAGVTSVKESVDVADTFGRLEAYRREVVSPKEQSTPITMSPNRVDGPLHWSVGQPLRDDLEGEAIRARFGLSWLAIGDTFEDSLVALIERMLNDKLFPRFRPADFRAAPIGTPTYRKRLWIGLSRPAPFATITYLAEGVTYEMVSFQAKRENPPNLYADLSFINSPKQADIYRDHNVNEKTLEIICETLRRK